MSASIAATAVITAARAALKPRMAADRPATPFACFESLVDEGGREHARELDPEHNRQTSDLIFQGHPLADQLLARADQRAEHMSLQRLHMHGLEEPGASQVPQPSRIVAIGLVGRQRLERPVDLAALDADHWETKLVQPVKQERRHSPRLEYDPTATRRFRQFAGDRLCCRLRLALANHHAFAIENANMRRDIEARKIVH
jgi:hypothetical protein